jgi:hypothetical protein
MHYHVINSLMIIEIIDINSVVTFKIENNPPVARNRYGPVALMPAF